MEYGGIVATRGIAEKMEASAAFCTEIQRALSRYIENDWGEICEEDKAANDMAVRTGERVLAAYQTSEGKIYIITEWDRSQTTILFPDEY